MKGNNFVPHKLPAWPVALKNREANNEAHRPANDKKPGNPPSRFGFCKSLTSFTGLERVKAQAVTSKSMKRRYFLGMSAAAGMMGLASCRPARPLAQTEAPLLLQLAGSDPQESALLLEARDGIEKYRKSATVIRLLQAGRPLQPGTDVEVRQVGHLYQFGISGGFTPATAINPGFNRERSAALGRLFNHVTAKCYWHEKWHQPIETVEGQREYGTFLGEIAWARAQGMGVKGHPLVWTVPKALPPWLGGYPYEKRLSFLEKHVRGLMQAAGPEVQCWDLCNEMLWEPSLRNTAQREWPHLEPINEILTYLEPAWHWAHEENPNALLALNEYGLVASSSSKVTAETQRGRYLSLAAEMQRRGCAPGALGVQAHVGEPYQLAILKQALQHLATSGLPLQVTEFWAKLEKNACNEGDPETALACLAAYVAKVYTLVFSLPETTHLTYWGGGNSFFDPESGRPNPVFKALEQLIANEWNTRLTLQANADGEVLFRGFKGQYEVTATVKGRRFRVPGLVRLSKPVERLEFAV